MSTLLTSLSGAYLGVANLEVAFVGSEGAQLILTIEDDWADHAGQTAVQAVQQHVGGKVALVSVEATTTASTSALGR